ncbi:hypothetical protein CTAYLR_005553 [Chrysophaeum taylorii]|uniref:Oxidoreductase n=1 Tax=Chrysophaeum taylorii TaxID=2483200 RepID=A0AAD7UK20_9STRA|nr:hypothetical protein CTAYLR_005553 [Chrysophaeum taylorii]
MVMVRIAVIGCGCIGKEHIRNVEACPGAKVAACVDPNPRMRTEAANLTSAPVFEDVEELREEETDAVIVCVPNHLHVVVCEKVMGKYHVLCEKPVATNLEDCRKLESKLSEDKVFAVGLEYRHIPTMRRLLETLPSVGNLKLLAIREHRFPFLSKVESWNRENQKTGGTLVEKGCHFFDFMALCARGLVPQTVFARGGQAVNHLSSADVDDHALVVVDFGSGLLCTLELCMFAEASLNQLEVSAVGEKGKIEAFAPAHGVRSNDLRANFRVGIREDRDWESRTTPPPPSAVLEEHVAMDFEHGDHAGSTYVELLEFCDACRTLANNNLATLHDATLSVAIGVAAHRSISENRLVRLDELLAF